MTTLTVEIRACRLKPGTRAGFHEAVPHRVLPMGYGMDVVTHGPSLMTTTAISW